MKNISEITKGEHRSFGARLFLSVLFSLLITAFVDYVIGEAIVFGYMSQHGLTERSELSEDMGFGMIGFFSFLLYAPVSLIASFFVCWKKFK